MRNVYLTGVSGFFGGQLLRDLTDAHDQFGKIYLPVRAKKNKTGQARFEDIVGSLGGTCVYLDSDAPIPAETNVVIFHCIQAAGQNHVPRRDAGDTFAVGRLRYPRGWIRRELLQTAGGQEAGRRRGDRKYR